MRGPGLRLARYVDSQGTTPTSTSPSVGEGPLDWRTLGRLKEAFEESDLPMRVDVLDWHAISDEL